MLDKLELIKKRWEETANLLSDPAITKDIKNYSRLSKEYKDLGLIVKAYEQYKEVLANISNTRHLLQTEKEEEFREMIKLEMEALNSKKEEIETHIKDLLIPRDPADEKNAILEIRAGTGGDEASIFAGDLYRMYSRFFERKKWKTEI